MAKDWIPYEIRLPEKWQVLEVAKQTKKHLFEVTGRLMAFWSWVSEQSVDGNLSHIPLDLLPMKFGGGPEFWEALEKVNWLERSGNGFRAPNAEDWLNRAGRARLLKNRRQSKWRGKERDSVDGHVDGSASTGASTTEQSRTVTEQYLINLIRLIRKTRHKQPRMRPTSFATSAAAPSSSSTTCTSPAIAPTATPRSFGRSPP